MLPGALFKIYQTSFQIEFVGGESLIVGRATLVYTSPALLHNECQPSFMLAFWL